MLLIAGWDHGSEDWASVKPAIAETTRVCAYDRFGTGTSDQPTAPQTFETQVADLHELLDEVGERGPYVVVGHSFGGAGRDVRVDVPGRSRRSHAHRRQPDDLA